MSTSVSSSDDATGDLFWGSCSSSHEEVQVRAPKRRRAAVQQTLMKEAPPARSWSNGSLLRRGDRLEDHVPARLQLNLLEGSLADQLLDEVRRLGETWEFEVSEMFGRVIQTRRKTKTLKEEDMSPTMRHAKGVVERAIQAQGFVDWTASHAVVNIYVDEDAQVAAHNDRLDKIGPFPVIGGLSLGARREFTFTENAPPRRKVVVELPHNCLVTMLPGCQESWKHSIERMKTVSLEHHKSGRLRVSITYRMAVPLPRPTCFCGKLEPQLKTIVAEGNPNCGKHFWSCGRNAYSTPGEDPCKFWQLFDYDAWEKMKNTIDI